MMTTLHSLDDLERLGRFVPHAALAAMAPAAPPA
jgi:hypothetical protein